MAGVMMTRMTMSVFVVLALAVAACSSDGGASTTTTSADTTSTTSDATTTTVATTTTTSDGPDIAIEPVVPGEDPDADEIVELFAVVFSGESTFEEKAALIDDSTGLETTVANYATASSGVGGIGLSVTGVGIAGDDAAVVYDLLFAGSAFQTDQDGEAIRGPDGWIVTRTYFCSIMALARVNCPVSTG